MIVGAAVTTGYAAGLTAMNRKAGECIAACTGGLVCNHNTGFCEAPRERCDSSPDHPVCMPSTETGDVAASAPGGKTAQIMPDVVPLSGDVVRIVTTAEKNPPSSK